VQVFYILFHKSVDGDGNSQVVSVAVAFRLQKLVLWLNIAAFLDDSVAHRGEDQGRQRLEAVSKPKNSCDNPLSLKASKSVLKPPLSSIS
jgi:hypothetical protein